MPQPSAPPIPPGTTPPPDVPKTKAVASGTPARDAERAAVGIAVVLLVVGLLSYDSIRGKGALSHAEAQYLLAPILAGTACWLALLVPRHTLTSVREAVAAAVVGIVGGVLAAVAASVANSDASKTALGFAALVGAIAGTEGVKRVVDQAASPTVDEAKVDGTKVEVKGRGLTPGLDVVVGQQVATLTNVDARGTSGEATLPVKAPEGEMRIAVLESNAGVPTTVT